MTHVRRHRGEPWNEMADSFRSFRSGHPYGCSVPSSRTELERWMMSFRGGPGWSSLRHVLRCHRGVKSGKTSSRNSKTRLLVNEEPKEVRALRIATLNVLTLSPAEESEVNGLRIPARQARLVCTFEDAANEVIGLQECRLPAHLVVREGFVMVASGARMGVMAVDCGSLLEARSKTIEANGWCAHQLVEGHERAQAWWEASWEMVTVALDVPTTWH